MSALEYGHLNSAMPSGHTLEGSYIQASGDPLSHPLSGWTKKPHLLAVNPQMAISIHMICIFMTRIRFMFPTPLDWFRYTYKSFRIYARLHK